MSLNIGIVTPFDVFMKKSKKRPPRKDVATWFHLHLCSSKKRDTSDWL